jgi:NAD(P)-dependent dehydrogenase (short-subunit alcohol dehydrogenase family)
MGKLQGKIALITGGNSGIGLAAAEDFVSEGAFVYITGRRQTELDAAVAKVGKNIASIQSDVTKMADLDKIYSTIQKEKGHLDIVFGNAGNGNLAPLGSITEENFDQIFDLNVKGLLFTVQKALPLLRDGSVIILNASIVSIKGFPGFSVYSASKAAVRSFARTWSVDLAPRKIRVNVVSPGTVPTPGYAGLGLVDDVLKEFVEQTSKKTPLGRVGAPDEIAKAVTFLASDDSSFVAGVELFVDGGFAQI